MDTIFDGPVLRPGDEGYDSGRTGFQLHAPHRPDLVVAAAGPADVRAAVAYARDRGLPVAVQATGHGLGTAADGGVLISTQRMTGVRIDPSARSARVSAGTRWEEVIAAAYGHGLAPLSGSAPGVGAVGYTLGGGLGLMARQYGYASDHVRSLDVVTADGEERHVTRDTEPDLFWALRGGRDAVGVVTGLEIGLVPHPRLYGGLLAFGPDRVERVLAAYPDWTRGLPEELSSSLSLMAYPDAPFVREEFRGRYVLQARIAYTGDRAEGERLVAPLRALGPLLADEVRELPYTESGTICNDPPFAHAYTGDGLLLRDADERTLHEVARLTGPGSPAPAIVQLNHLGGALARPPEVPSAVGFRDARYVLRLVWPLDGADRDAVRAVHRSVAEAVAPLGRSLNFVFGPLTAREVREAYEPAGYRRLAGIKKASDPEDMFRLGQPLQPASSRA